MKNQNIRLGLLAIACAVITSGMFSQTVTGSGTNGFIPKWTGTNTIGNSVMTESGSSIGIGVSPSFKLDVNGSVNTGTVLATSNAYHLGGSKFLHHNGVTSCLFAGVQAGQSSSGAANTFLGYNVGAINGSSTNNTGVGFNVLPANYSGIYNTGMGSQSLYMNTTGSQNTAYGGVSLYFNTTGDNNTAVGYTALLANSSGDENTAVGYESMDDNTTGSQNTAVGAYSLNGLTSATQNSAFGYQALNSSNANGNSAFGHQALYSNTSAANQCAFGYRALYANTTGGTLNNAFGYQALAANTTGDGNSAFGYSALAANTTSSGNSAFGYNSLAANTTGISNSAFGYQALTVVTTGSYNCAFGRGALGVTTGSENTAMGYASLPSNTSGNFNTAQGVETLLENTTGSDNTAIGYWALHENVTGSRNTALGELAGFGNSSGTNNTFVGYGADANAGTYTNCAAFGNGTIVTASNKIFVGNTAITQISGQVNFTAYSDQRFKTEVTENVKGLDFIKKLRPVTYKVKAEQLHDYLNKNMPDEVKKARKAGMDFTESSSIVHSGFLAQEVEQASKEAGFVNTIVSTPSNEDDLYGIAYAEMVVPLVKAVQEQQEMIDDLKKTNAKQDSVNQVLQQQIDQIVKNAHTNSQQQNATEAVHVELSDNDVIVLNDAVPNPFAEQTTITYYIPDNVGSVKIIFYNSQGQSIKTVDIRSKGNGQLNVFANDLTNGIYSYTLIADGKPVATKKLIRTE